MSKREPPNLAVLNVLMVVLVLFLFAANVGLGLIAAVACALVAFELNKRRVSGSGHK